MGTLNGSRIPRSRDIARFLMVLGRLETEDSLLLDGTRRRGFGHFRRFADNDDAFSADGVMFPVVFDIPADLKIRWDLDIFFNDRPAQARAPAYMHTGHEHRRRYGCAF